MTESTPKPALTLVDRPFLAYMIEWLAGHGVSEVVLACGFLPQVLREALAGEKERAGISIRYVVEPEPLGTAGAIRFAADQLGDELEDRFLALNGDVLTDLDLSALLETHAARRSGASFPPVERERRTGTEPCATIGLHRVEDSSAFGLVRTGAEGEVLEFLEKTGEAVPGEVNAGMYVLERSVLDLIPPGRECSVEREVFPRLVGRGLRAAVLDGYWVDIGTPERYLEATWDILEGRVRTRVEPTGPGVLVDPAAEVDAAGAVGPRAVVGPGCRIGAGAAVTGSVLLAGSAVGEGARVEGSILAPGAAVADGAAVRDAVAAPDERLPG